MRGITCQGLFAAGLAVSLALIPVSAPRAQDPAPVADKTAPNPPKRVAADSATPAKHPVKTADKKSDATDKKDDPAHKQKLAAKPAKPKPAEQKSASSKQPAQPADKAETAAAPAKSAPSGAKGTPAQIASLPAKAGSVPVVTLPAVVVASPKPPAPLEPAQAAAFVAEFLDEAFRIARTSGATALQRRAQLADLFTTKMDAGGIAVSTTANVLSSTSADFQRRFRTILISYLVETYYPRIELASDAEVKVESLPAPPLPDGTAVVWTIFSKSGWPSQSVKWHLAPTPDGFKIVDIFSAGASLVQMERDTFLSVMRNGGVPELMAKLDQRTKALASAATE
jgi:ABC-type transporter MlaC component